MSLSRMSGFSALPPSEEAKRGAASVPPADQGFFLERHAHFPLRSRIPLILFGSILLAAFLFLGTNLIQSEREIERDGLSLSSWQGQFLRRAIQHEYKEESLPVLQEALTGIGEAAEDGRVFAVLVDGRGQIIDSSRPELLNREALAVLPGISSAWDAQMEVDVRNTGMHGIRAGQTIKATGITRLSSNGDAVVSLLPVSLGSSTGSYLFLEHDLAARKSAYRLRVATEALIVAALLALMAGFAWLYLHHALTRRATRLIATARAAQEGTLSVRSQLQGEDELAEISQAFDNMLSKLEKTQRRLSQSERQLNQALLAANMLVWAYDPRSELISFMRFDDEPVEVGARPTLQRMTYNVFLEGVHPNDRDTFDASLHSGSKIAALEYRILNLKGEYRWYSLMGREVAGVFTGVSWNIHHRKQAELELEKYRTRLEDMVSERTGALNEAYQELESFSYSACHDLQAPLRAIKGFSRIIQDEYTDRLDEYGMGTLGRIIKASERMSALIDDLLTLSHSSRSELHRQPVNVSEMATQIVDRLYASAPNRQAKIEVTKGIRLQADPSLLAVVLENLIGNAWKYASKQPSTVIEIGQELKKNQPVIFVRDNGVGFDMTHARKLFEPFQRLHAASEFEGSGIGLATVRRIIRRHGGKIWAESQPGQGACFYFTLGPASPSERKLREGQPEVEQEEVIAPVSCAVEFPEKPTDLTDARPFALQ